MCEFQFACSFISWKQWNLLTLEWQRIESWTVHRWLAAWGAAPHGLAAHPQRLRPRCNICTGTRSLSSSFLEDSGEQTLCCYGNIWKRPSPLLSLWQRDEFKWILLKFTKIYITRRVLLRWCPACLIPARAIYEWFEKIVWPFFFCFSGNIEICT